MLSLQIGMFSPFWLLGSFRFVITLERPSWTTLNHVHPFHLFNKYILSNYCVPGPILSTGETASGEGQRKSPALMGLALKSGEDNKITCAWLGGRSVMELVTSELIP
jgi:hypothetical protein